MLKNITKMNIYVEKKLRYKWMYVVKVNALCILCCLKQFIYACLYTVELQWVEHLWDYENIFAPLRP